MMVGVRVELVGAKMSVRRDCPNGNGSIVMIVTSFSAPPVSGAPSMLLFLLFEPKVEGEKNHYFESEKRR